MAEADFKVTFPSQQKLLDQDEEWFIVEHDSGREKMRIHEYGRLYSIPGLYEEVVYDRLKCTSPEVVCGMLAQEIEQSEAADDALKVLDFGAGNGIAGEHLDKLAEVETLVGVDICPEAADAVRRDRPGLYDEYHVLDLARTGPEVEESLGEHDFNALVTVAALGFGDIPTTAFINAFNLCQDGAWVAFNIRDKFLEESDDTGYRRTLEAMMGQSLDVHSTREYAHRISMTGEELYYQAVVGRKLDQAQPPAAS